MGCGRTVIGLVLVLALTIAVGYGFQQGNKEADFDRRLVELGYEFAPVAKPVGIYKRVVVVGKMAYLSGHIPISEKGEILTGKVGSDVDLVRAQAAAERCAIGMLSSLKAELGSLNGIKRLVKTTGMVNCTPDFVDQPKVINGCSQLFRELFGADNGVGARAAVGMNALPVNAICEIEAVFELK